MAEEMKFSLETVAQKAQGILEVKDYEQVRQDVITILEATKVFVIQSDSDKKLAKEKRAFLNKCVKAIDRERIDAVDDFTRMFQDQCNSLKNMFDERQKEFADEIKKYEDSQKLVVADLSNTTRLFTATIKFNDEKLIKKLTDFCGKNGCELTIK